MNAITLGDLQKGKTKYLTFSNKDGKRWSIPMKNMRTALELYEPSGAKGRLLKSFLPVTAGIGAAKRLLHGEYGCVLLGGELQGLLEKCFGENLEYSVFWGTPCVDRKITVQIYRGRDILGYCKLGSSQRISELFLHEKQVLDLLSRKGVAHVPECLAVEQVSGQYWAFVQSTEKKRGAETEHGFGEKQAQFLEDMRQKTKCAMPFEQTDYCRSLLYLENHLDMIENRYRAAAENALDAVRRKYGGQIVDWGVCHRDFTPWNTCTVGGELFVFDFEYALLNAPGGLDRWHYFVQTKVFEEKCDMEQTAQAFLSLTDKDVFQFQSYLLDIISLYLMRGGSDDIQTANLRAELLGLIAK